MHRLVTLARPVIMVNLTVATNVLMTARNVDTVITVTDARLNTTIHTEHSDTSRENVNGNLVNSIVMNIVPVTTHIDGALVNVQLAPDAIRITNYGFCYCSLLHERRLT